MLLTEVCCWYCGLVWFLRNLRISLHLLKLTAVAAPLLPSIFTTKLKAFNPQQTLVLVDALTHYFHLTVPRQ